ncbi:MAG TPA: NAD-dependent epimerase/dehydratase family protein [Solirubrobacteraceae bacterium]|jgi:dTDP-L-rhamnose 4-epimerase|nr:NAD-dependent epimerase/dehydratase family protein [Solirubrobacteraceae bacterium]
MILVTGGAGFIGSHIVELLVADGHEVRVLDMVLPSAHRERPQVHPDAEFIEGDVRDAAVLVDALADVDAVCHQAAMVGLGADIRDLPDYVSHNDLGTAMLLGELARREFEGRVVLASSMVVYGEGRYRCERDGIVAPSPRDIQALAGGEFEVACPECGAQLAPESVPESAVLDPRNVYAATKLHQEHLGLAFSRETGVPVTALRYHNVYGPRMPRDTPYAGVASIFRSALENGQPPRVFEDGGQLRDFVHVRDVARANVLALTEPTPVPGAFNIGSGRPRSILQMAKALAKAFDGDLDPVVTGDFRLGDVRHVFATTDLAGEVLGFIPQEDFADGMAEFADAPLRA